MNAFWSSSTYQIVKAMKATGNQEGVIQRWKVAVEAWARMNRDLPDAQAVLAWLPLWQPRCAYTADEMAPMFPALAVTLGFTNRIMEQKSPRRLEFELDYAGLPSHFLFGRKYFIVERISYWAKMSAVDLETELFDARN